jgi:hypothetical protein
MERREQYARWLEANAADQNSSDPQVRQRFLTVADAYQKASAAQSPAAGDGEAARPAPVSAPAQEQAPAVQRPSIAQQALAAGYPIAFPYGISEAPTQQQSQDIAIGALRYGAPIAAGLATGGFGLVPAAIMAGTAGASETVAQFLERETGRREEMAPREALAATIAAGSPIFRVARPVAGASPGVASFLASAVSSGIGGEAARSVETGEFLPESRGKFDAAMRFTTPFLSGAAGAFGGSLKATQDTAEQISQARGGGGLFNPDGTFANVLLSEANPAFLGMERRAIESGRAAAVDRMVRTDDNMAKIAMDLVQQAPDATPIARELMKNMKFAGVRDSYLAAEKAANRAQEAARIARENNSADAQKLMGIAEEALREKMRARAAFDQGIAQVAGPKLPNLFSIDPATVALEVQKVANDSVEAVKMARRGLYESAGIQINDPVIAKSDVLAQVSKAAKSGGLLEGDEARAAFVSAVNAAFGDSPTLSREAFLDFKNSYASRLSAGLTNPREIRAKNKLADEHYAVLRDAATDFIGRNYGADIQTQWKAANAAYAQSVSSLGSDAVTLLQDGDFGEFFRRVKSGGRNSQAWQELNQYADFLSGVSKQAIASRQVNPADLAVADNFRQHVYAGLLKGMFEESLVDGARKASKIGGREAIDPQKFVQNIAELETRGEFPIKDVFGADSSTFRRLARFIDQKFDGRMTQKDLTDWLKMLPDDGADIATKRLAYRKGVQEALMDTNIPRRNAALRRVEAEAGELRKDADALYRDYQQAANDPLTRFFADTNFRIDPNDPANNSKLASRLVQEVDPSLMKDFVKAAKGSGKEQLIEDIGKIAAADAVRRFVPSSYEGVDKLRLRDITDFFYSPDDKLRKQRENLISLIGQDRYNVIKTKVVDPISGILKGREAVQPFSGAAFNDVRALAAAYGGAAQGNLNTGTIKALGLANIYKSAEGRMYNLLANVYLDPKFGPALASVGYDLARFAQMSPVYSTQVNLALAKDAQANQAELQRQYLTQGQPTR